MLDPEWLAGLDDARLLCVLRSDRAWVRRHRRDGVNPARCWRQAVRDAKRECRRRGLSTRQPRAAR